jgi:ADP-ribosyl-[dinitrogen reductase] hydrolase
VTDRSRVVGCFLGGAIGDALGAPTEFMDLATIRRVYGPDGVTGLSRSFGGPRQFTDDTQMTLWTAEGLIRARRSVVDGGRWDPVVHVNDSYLRWFRTQGQPIFGDDGSVETGWLITEHGLWARRAPGNTCLSALRVGGLGRPDDPINDSKGCGGVMRVAPVGFVPDIDVFELGCDTAALTHGHPSGYVASGALAVVIAEISGGVDLASAVVNARERAAQHPESGEVIAAIDKALALAESGPVMPERIERLGGGWVAEEALAIGVFCAITASDYASGVLAAVNHSGDTDSTGSITGQILGLIHGSEAIPGEWVDAIELREVIERVATDMAATFLDGTPPDNESYPGR